MTIRNLDEANAAIQPYVPLVAQLTGKDTTLTRIRPLMKLLAHPEEKLRVIHVAGTSGKTSTAYYMAALLQATGKNIGLTVSPHISSVTERVQINGEPLDEHSFCNELGEFLEIVQAAPERPSYFELLYAFSLWVFMRQQVDYAVVETGMGGLYDATNVVTRHDKVCIITDIGLDHTHILGTTLPAIASQKIGIAHDKNEVFTFRQDMRVMEVFLKYTAIKHAKLNIVDQAELHDCSGLAFEGLPPYQEHNWLLAYGVYEFLRKRDNLKNLTQQELAQTLRIRIPGRMEVRHNRECTIIMDGAHNVQKMTAFIKSFQALYGRVRPTVLVALKHDKQYKEVADLLSDFSSEVIVTSFQGSQDLPFHSMNPIMLAEAFHAVPVRVIESPHKALSALRKTDSPLKVITGSFYLLSILRKELL